MMSDDEKLNSFMSTEIVDEDFFNEIVENKLRITRDKFKLRLVYIVPATGKNENFASVVYRAKIGIEIIETGERQFLNVIIKALLTTIKELKEFGVFPRERFMYEEIIGSFEKILDEQAGMKISFGPQCLAVHSDPYEIIILEDLKAIGYEVMDRKVGVNLQQALMVMEKLAIFHSASAIKHQKDGIIKDFLDRNISMPKFPKDSPIMISLDRMFSAFLEGVKKTNVPKSCVEKISNWNIIEVMDLAWKGSKPMKCGFEILNHGDDWVTNMMFKVDENGETTAMKFIDYQMSYWGSPVADLFYFIVSSVNNDVKVKHFDEFIEHYQRELEKMLKKLNYNGYIPTLKDIYEDIEDKKELIATQLFGIMFICKYNSEKEIIMADLFSGMIDDDTLKLIYSNDNYLKALETWLPFMDERGFLDILPVINGFIIQKRP
ncbi:hypothetical protein PVAND_005367 [Polypedilum vanderplanki]|uniref:CHK kinase-like domain-containing protein n=1 Tax=Polypedilum vanderplanki TaxID=319348 RepID=A0A9J6BZR4_POLVA|nr:hypothetical protein PVAND_005367 [Polypedilum vanderplanki]